MINIIRSIINFFGFNNVIVDGIGERGMRDSSIIRYNEVHDMYDKIIKDLGDMSAYVSKGYIYDKIKTKQVLVQGISVGYLIILRKEILGLSKKERLISLSFLLKTITSVIVNNYLNHDQRLLHLHIPLLG